MMIQEYVQRLKTNVNDYHKDAFDVKISYIEIMQRNFQIIVLKLFCEIFAVQIYK